MRHLRIELFGGLRLCRGDEVVDHFATRKVAGLLARLAYFIERPQAREQLIDLFWPEMDEKDGRNNLRYSLSVLRRLFVSPDSADGAILVSDNTIVRLDARSATTDVALFEAALKRQDYESAVSLYTGELLSGFYEEWILPERQRLEIAYVGALKQLVTQREVANDLIVAVQYALKIVAIDPLEEAAHIGVIRLYGEAGQPENARRQFQELSRILREQLSESPSTEAVEAMHHAYGERCAGNGTPRKPRPNGEPAHGFPSPFPTINPIRQIGPDSPVTQATPSPKRRRLTFALVCLLPVLVLLGAVPLRAGWLAHSRQSAVYQPIPPGMARQLNVDQIESKLLAVESSRDRADLHEAPAHFHERQAQRVELVAELAEQAWNSWYGPDELVWLMHIERIHDDLNAVLRWSVENNPPRALQICGALTRFWYMQKWLTEGGKWTDEAFASNPHSETNVRARALIGRAWLLTEAEDLSQGVTASQDALSIYRKNDDRWGIAHALRIMGMAYGDQRINAKSIPCDDDAFRRFEEIGDKRGMALTLFCRSFHFHKGDSEGEFIQQSKVGYDIAKRSLDLFREIGNEWGVQVSLESMAVRAQLFRDAQRMRARAEEARSAKMQRDTRRKELLWDIYRRARERRDWQTIKRVLTLRAEIDSYWLDDRDLIRMLDRFVDYYTYGDANHRRAAELLGAVTAAVESHHAGEFNRSFESLRAALIGPLGTHVYEDNYRAGRSLSLAAAIHIATSP